MKTQKHFLLIILIVFAFASCKTEGFKSAEIESIMDNDANVLMPLLTINEKSDSLFLRTQAREVKKKHIGSTTLDHLRKRMLATVNDSLNAGVGIAAPQVGVGLSMIYVQRFDKTGEPFEVYYNPVIVEYGDSINSGQEGCLSVPNYRGIVDRSHNIVITYLDSLGEKQTEQINDFTAVIFQHEVDHVNGVLYYDHISRGFESLSFSEE